MNILLELSNWTVFRMHRPLFAKNFFSGFIADDFPRRLDYKRLESIEIIILNTQSTFHHTLGIKIPVPQALQILS